MAFLDLYFPHDIAQGSQALIQRRTDVVALASGYEQTNARWSQSRRSWQTGLAIRSRDDLARVVALFEEANGREHTFRFKDWTDYKSCDPSQIEAATDVLIGVGDDMSLTFQIIKTYGQITPYHRPIALPVAGSVRIALDGAEVASGWSVDPLTGVVTFTTAPAAGVQITAGFRFDVPVRFGADEIALDMAYFSDTQGAGSFPDIPLIERRADNPF